MALIDLVPPFVDEDPVGYMRRLALRNGYPGWKSLMRAIELNPSVKALWANKPALSKALGLEAEWLNSVMPVNGCSTGLGDPLFSRSRSDPFCSECLSDSAHLRRAWSHCFVTACPEHGGFLIDVCPECGEQLVTGRVGIEHCDCGFDLRHAKAAPASDIHRFVSARLQGDARLVPGIVELGEMEDYIQLAKLLFLLATRFDSTSVRRPGKTTLPKTVAESLKFLEGAFSLLESWPDTFGIYVNDRLAQGRSNAYSLAGRLGGWYLGLKAICVKEGAFAPVWQVLSNVVFDTFDGVLRGEVGLTPSAGRVRHWMSVQEGARALGLRKTALSEAVERREVRARVIRQGTHYRMAMIERTEIERIRATRDQWLSESYAAEKVGVTDSVLKSLVRAGLLESDAHWRSTILKSGPVSAVALEKLEPQLEGFLMPDTTVKDVLALNDLTARRTLDHDALVRLYQAIFAGKLRPVGRDETRRLGGYIFPAREVHRYLGTAALSAALTIPQLERATGWKYEVIDHWIKLGLLESESVTMHGGSVRVVSARALCEFRREWLPVSDLAASAQTKSSALYEKLAALGIPVTGHRSTPTGARRGGLVPMARLVGLIEWCRTAKANEQLSGAFAVTGPNEP